MIISLIIKKYQVFCNGIKKIYLKIDKDEKADRLEKFYSQFGFSVVNKVVEDDEVFVDCDTDKEYVMSRSISFCLT